MELREFQSMGGKARAAKLSKERRVEISRLAALVRWAGDEKVSNLVVTKEGVEEYHKCQAPYCDGLGREVMVHGMKAWLCEEHGK